MANNLQLPFAGVRLYLDDIITGTAGGPEFSTDVSVNHGGFEQRNANWDYPLGRWDVGQRGYCQATKDYLLSFFRQRRGKYQGFLWRDLADWQATAVPLVSETGFTTQGLIVITGPGSGQIIKRYSDGFYVADRLIQVPIADGLVLPSGWTLGALGTVSAPGIAQATPLNFSFDTPVRFDTDHLRTSLQSTEGTPGGADYEAIFYVESLPLVEVRNPQVVSSAAQSIAWAAIVNEPGSNYSPNNTGVFMDSQTVDTGESVFYLRLYFKILGLVPANANIAIVASAGANRLFSYDAAQNLGVVEVAYSNIRGYGYIYPGTVTVTYSVGADIIGELKCVVTQDAYADLQWLAFSPA